MSDVATTHDEPHGKLHKLDFGLPVALVIAIIASMTIVVVAYIMYLNDSNQKYDIARPGTSEENQALQVIDEDTDTTSPVDAPAVQRKLDFLSKEVNALNGFNQFNVEDLSDQNLQILPGEPSL